MPSRLRVTAGSTSAAVLSTKTPPTNLKHFLVGSSCSIEAITKLQEEEEEKKKVRGEGAAKEEGKKKDSLMLMSFSF